MAITLSQFAADESDRIEAKYAPFRGKRIPCRSGEHRYHLDPRVAEHCDISASASTLYGYDGE